MCSICKSTITYVSNGKNAFLKHSKNKQPFMCRMKTPEARKFDIFINKIPKIFAEDAAPLQPPQPPEPLLNASSKLSAQRYVLKVQAFSLNSTYIPAYTWLLNLCIDSLGNFGKQLSDNKKWIKLLHHTYLQLRRRSFYVFIFCVNLILVLMSISHIESPYQG